MSTRYFNNNNNQSLVNNQSLGSLRYRPYLDNVTPVQKGQIDRISGKEKGFFDGLGDAYKKGKEAIFGRGPVSQLSRDAAGNFDTSIMSPEEWRDFGSKGGYVGADGELFNIDGSKFEVGAKEGLGGYFSSESLAKAGQAAKNVGHIFSAYQAADDIFGRGAKSRREAERQAKADFEQRYAMNKMTMDKFKEDNERFKRQREAITASY